MNFLEILVIGVLLASIINIIIPIRIKKQFFIIIIILLVTIDLLVNSYRWQMNFLYALLFIDIIINLITLKKPEKKFVPKKRKILKINLTIISIVVLIAASLPLFLFPITNLPKPTGLYSVGTTYLHFKDINRLETLTDKLSDYREFNARVWYPTDRHSNAKQVRYKDSQSTIGFIDPATLTPSFIFGHYNLIKTNSYLKVPVSNKQNSYPVIVFSPGFLADYTDYQILLEELASNGYIVIAPETPYEFKSVIKADGTVVPFIKKHVEDYKKEAERTLPLWTNFWLTNDDKERKTIAKQILKDGIFMNIVLEIRAKDIQFMINELKQMKPGKLLFGKLNLDELGIIGHSMGGAVAGQVCLVDNRFKAGINLDGFQWGTVYYGTVHQPFMMMYSEPFANANNYILDSFNNSLYQLVIKGSTHSNFDDNMFVMPISKQIGMLGTIDKSRMRAITNDYILSFYNKYLKNENAPLLKQIPSKYSEVTFKMF